MPRCHRRALALLSAILAAAPVVSYAQEGDAPVRWLEIGGGLASLSLRDETTSPLRYGGTAPQVQLGYAALRARSRFVLRAGAAFGSLTSALSARDLPREADVHGWFEGEYFRTARDSARSWHWMTGATLAVRVAGRKHYFANPSRSGLGYGFASITLAPAGGLEFHGWARGTFSVRVAVPLLALVSRPYSDVQVIKYGGVPARVVTVSSYRSVDAGAAYARPLGSRVEVTLGYRLVVEYLDDVQPYRSVHHALWLATAVRIGGGGSR